MPLLKPPDPEIPTRKFYLRIEEPLAVSLDRYAEFLGAEGIDHVISQALEFVFRKDTEFKEWLAQHPDPSAGRNPSPRRRYRSARRNTAGAVAEREDNREAAQQ